jgi:phosphoglycolate phosphatase-like HAD superfamily hydrolase
LRTLFADEYSDIGEPRFEIIETLKETSAKGHKLILWTCRMGDFLNDAIKACAMQGLFFDEINNNLLDNISRYSNNSRKIFADIYIDDRSILPENFESCFRTRNTKTQNTGM